MTTVAALLIRVRNLLASNLNFCIDTVHRFRMLTTVFIEFFILFIFVAFAWCTKKTTIIARPHAFAAEFRNPSSISIHHMALSSSRLIRSRSFMRLDDQCASHSSYAQITSNQWRCILTHGRIQVTSLSPNERLLPGHQTVISPWLFRAFVR